MCEDAHVLYVGIEAGLRPRNDNGKKVGSYAPYRRTVNGMKKEPKKICIYIYIYEYLSIQPLYSANICARPPQYTPTGAIFF